MEDNISNDPSRVREKAVKSVKWTALAELASRSIQPLVTLILAGVLTPAEFGVVGVAVMAAGLAQIFQDFGLGKALIQRGGDIEGSSDVVFWMNSAFSVVLYLLVYASSPSIAGFFHEPKATEVLRVLCLQIILSGTFSVHQALLQREFLFRKLFFVRIASSVVPGLVSIPMAFMGYGVWSLVYGALSGAIAQWALFWALSGWRPRLSFDRALALKLAGFGAWAATESFLGWVIVWGDSVILGRYMGVTDLGVYRVGVTFVLFIYGMFFSPLTPVAYSSFSRLQEDREALNRAFLKVTKIVSSVAVPVGIGLFVLSRPIAGLLFGDKWEGIGTVIALMGLMYSVSWLVSMNPEAYRAIGRPDAEPKRFVAVILFYVPACVVAAPYGLYVFCLARLAITAAGLLTHFYAARKVLGLPFNYIGGCVRSSVAAGLVMALVIYYATGLIGPYEGLNGWLKVLFLSGSGAAVYILMLRMMEREHVEGFFELIRQSVK